MHLLHCYWDESSSPSTISISLRAGIVPVPQYAILSHRWAANPDDEVTFEDMTFRPGIARTKRGYEKIRGCCVQALRDGYSWVWIDTCCIDKRSSAELSEAINSMYNWYEKSETCYAYLEDVCSLDGPSPLRESTWFKRGWTLQELIAPAEVEFFSRDWNRIGTKTELAPLLANVSRVAQDALTDGIHVYQASLAEKMSWAAGRETTKEEDRAYSLMGIFGVSMPTLYGEGFRAFTRLQQEILRTTNDHSIFTWQRKSLAAGLLAESPDEFVHSSEWLPLDYQNFVDTFGISNPKPDFTTTNFGLHIQLPLAPIPGFEGYYLAFLACTRSFDDISGPRMDLDSWPAIILRRSPGGFPRQFMRTSFQNQMITYARLADNEGYDTEPIWISLADDISPLVWKASSEELSTHLLSPVSEATNGDTVTLIMERRHRHINIVDAYPHDMFSHGNEVRLGMSRTAANSLGVLIARNERGRSYLAVVFFTRPPFVCVGLSLTLGHENADRAYRTILTQEITLIGLIAIPLKGPDETSMYVGRYFVSMECVNAGDLIYRFTIGPGRHDREFRRGICSGESIQLNSEMSVFLGKDL
ncbi:HET-domain-containing protein [Trematosphaeria pertusa]|uniref:HET-domain-containing protein n=1 Tax=Trematosphaeria pertusa TaxID=390896 RepID=A0A6A6IVC5_9PLEO|nr:HET-domain-containing protein [Trematosphaeria pertusa]KAF2254198.1 HET-domain-containing protein [Trematosphaeria pertusa]